MRTFAGNGKELFSAVEDLDLEGIVTKRAQDPYDASRTRWFKIKSAHYSQAVGRADLFKKRA